MAKPENFRGALYKRRNYPRRGYDLLETEDLVDSRPCEYCGTLHFRSNLVTHAKPEVEDMWIGLDCLAILSQDYSKAAAMEAAKKHEDPSAGFSRNEYGSEFCNNRLNVSIFGDSVMFVDDVRHDIVGLSFEEACRRGRELAIGSREPHEKAQAKIRYDKDKKFFANCLKDFEVNKNGNYWSEKQGATIYSDKQGGWKILKTNSDFPSTYDSHYAAANHFYQCFPK